MLLQWPDQSDQPQQLQLQYHRLELHELYSNAMVAATEYGCLSCSIEEYTSTSPVMDVLQSCF